MRYIDFDIIDKDDPAVKDWIKKAKTRLKTLSSKATHKERADYLRQANFWSQFKPILIKYYGEKCWYSECSLKGSYGDVDHFRPKNQSKDITDSIILEDGYWWLAYDYLNYRLSCEICNRPYGSGGKDDFFPIKAGTTPAINPNKNDIPMLLDPCNQYDAGLIDCDESGAIIALSDNTEDVDRIEISKKIYNWNCFNPARKEARVECQLALKLFEMSYENAEYAENMTMALEKLCRLADPKTPYSSFSKRYIEIKIQDKPYKDVIQKILQL